MGEGGVSSGLSRNELRGSKKFAQDKQKPMPCTAIRRQRTHVAGEVGHEALSAAGRLPSVFSLRELKSAPVIDEVVVDDSYGLDDGGAVVGRRRDEYSLSAPSQVGDGAKGALENRMRGKKRWRGDLGNENPADRRCEDDTTVT